MTTKRFKDYWRDSNGSEVKYNGETKVGKWMIIAHKMLDDLADRLDKLEQSNPTPQ